jgi:Tfp pilus assembly protein PilO
MAGLGEKINSLKKNFLDNAALQQLDKKKIGGILFVALVLVYLDLAFLMSLQLKAIKNTGAEFKKLTAEMARFEREYDQSQRARADASSMAKEIISEAEIPLLLQDISDIANKNDVRILRLNPAREIKRKRGAPVTELNPNLIVLDMICDYHSLGVFISELENAAKFMAVEELRIIPDSSSVFQQKVNLVIKTYVRK